ncbi:hypothetical protein KIP88_29280 [Bradyrhizobium sp. SRL28]|uniref:hypothetical protein n=1 Tax=Bradyrhizobium sp. SRL28 TaxID=2836178 RepID=UPI001BDDCCB4|nr:hypothetical protein [Bradyrhizobium sp. SRL28]
MLRWMTPFLVAIFAVGTAAADESPGAAKAADGPTAVKPADPPAAAKPAENPAATKRTEKKAAGRRAAFRAASQLPPGLPRAHYNYRTTVAPPAPPLYVRRGRTLVVEEEVLVPTGIKAYAPRIFGTPLLPGSSTLPGYYGTSHSYSYDGPYYGGPYEPYWNRLPYACGVYGYC